MINLFPTRTTSSLGDDYDADNSHLLKKNKIKNKKRENEIKIEHISLSLSCVMKIKETWVIESYLIYLWKQYVLEKDAIELLS